MPKLAAFVIGRRAVAVAVFTGKTLEHCETHHLPEDWNKAVAALVGFVHYIVEQLEVQAAALDSLDQRAGERSNDLGNKLIETLRSLSVSVQDIPNGTLLEAFGHPPLKSFSELRQISTTLWPYLYDANDLTLEAAALGLYVQVERLIEINS